MKALVCRTPGEFNYIDKEMPLLEEGMVLLRMKRLGICGTDYHAFEGTQPFFEYPRILGHEIAAEVVNAGTALDFKAGDLVTISPYFYCGTCIACRSGRTNCCVKIKVFGVHIDGAMQEYITVPASALVSGEGLTVDELALIEPLAIGAHGVGLAQLSKGDTVVILGAGPIGLGTIAFAKISGAEVIVIDVNDNRLSFCRERLGIVHTINPLKEDSLAQLSLITNGEFAKVVIDCTGNLKAINNAFRFLAHTGKFIMIGLQKGTIEVVHPEFHKREAMLMSSRNALPHDFAHVIDCIRKGLVKPLDFVTHRVPFSLVKEEFNHLLQANESLIKALISFDE
ncbi:zinc-binding alcohol dehydrogenase family protein [Pedobacter zeae]|uniref:2-desacetyl-2-hydroxyethyl bacteriochlorophyllide A dehydrogenase n=1 Tax=Pedobacter zeae TaxID=1737356 RepID=A0A7W6KB20_9SPHI|nr:zinc-binding alcohol dehydrogenase family protein [Pedobacter zeae]MBB4107596.1 2-desacetyl-2-hydroxyethyl bacteriochlorophyllide A dehydrogenase [Pedobacter zeae]GGG98305.1 alcohol dehydrogenase [Pedobacter zeae]